MMLQQAHHEQNTMLVHGPPFSIFMCCMFKEKITFQPSQQHSDCSDRSLSEWPTKWPWVQRCPRANRKFGFMMRGATVWTKMKMKMSVCRTQELEQHEKWQQHEERNEKCVFQWSVRSERMRDELRQSAKIVDNERKCICEMSQEFASCVSVSQCESLWHFSLAVHRTLSFCLCGARWNVATVAVLWIVLTQSMPCFQHSLQLSCQEVITSHGVQGPAQWPSLPCGCIVKQLQFVWIHMLVQHVVVGMHWFQLCASAQQWAMQQESHSGLVHGKQFQIEPLCESPDSQWHIFLAPQCVTVLIEHVDVGSNSNDHLHCSSFHGILVLVSWHIVIAPIMQQSLKMHCATHLKKMFVCLIVPACLACIDSKLSAHTASSSANIVTSGCMNMKLKNGGNHAIGMRWISCENWIVFQCNQDNGLLCFLNSSRQWQSITGLSHLIQHISAHPTAFTFRHPWCCWWSHLTRLRWWLTVSHDNRRLQVNLDVAPMRTASLRHRWSHWPNC